MANDFLQNYSYNDSLTSLIGGMGDIDRDKLVGTHYSSNYLTKEQLVNAYVTSWIPKRIVNLPAFDSFRKWRNWKADANQIASIEKLEKRLLVKQSLFKANIVSRLFGGGAVYLGTGTEDPSEPLDVEKTNEKLEYLTVFNRYELIAGGLENTPLSRDYGKPKFYTLSSRTAGAVEIHPSRLVIFLGDENPDPWNPVNTDTTGWANSVLQASYDAARQSDSVNANIANLVFEANVDVFGIPDFMDSIGDKDYRTKVLERLTLAAANKSVNKSLLMDSEETFERKNVSFAQLPDIIQRFLLIVSASAGIPMTRFIGSSPDGMNSTGENDMRNYYDMIQSRQSLYIEPAIANLDQLLIKTSLGNVPENIWYEWTPLQQMNEIEIAEIGSKYADMVTKLVDAMIFGPNELRKPVINQFTELGVFPGFDVDITNAENLEAEEIREANEGIDVV